MDRSSVRKIGRSLKDLESTMNNSVSAEDQEVFIKMFKKHVEELCALTPEEVKMMLPQHPDTPWIGELTQEDMQNSLIVLGDLTQSLKSSREKGLFFCMKTLVEAAQKRMQRE